MCRYTRICIISCVYQFRSGLSAIIYNIHKISFLFLFSLGDYTAAVFQHWRDIERTRVNEVGDGADGPAAAEAQSQMNCSRNNPITAAP